ncbi:MAG: hypothetical protein IPL62_04310 [Caulobacteraceae bacterium]|nr:hypothetical protein [Caulobacteraceae bacterium]
MQARIFAAAFAFGLMMSGTAVADEVWSLPSGNQLVYDRDVGNVAVLTYRAEQGLDSGQIFVVGLGGQFEGRGSYQAYWVEADDAGAACPASIVDAEHAPLGDRHRVVRKPQLPIAHNHIARRVPRRAERTYHCATGRWRRRSLAASA